MAQATPAPFKRPNRDVDRPVLKAQPPMNADRAKLAYTIGEAADALGVSRRKINYLIEQGDLPTIWAAGRRLIRAEALRAYLDAEEARNAGHKRATPRTGSADIESQDSRLIGPSA